MAEPKIELKRLCRRTQPEQRLGYKRRKPVVTASLTVSQAEHSGRLKGQAITQRSQEGKCRGNAVRSAVSSRPITSPISTPIGSAPIPARPAAASQGTSLGSSLDYAPSDVVGYAAVMAVTDANGYHFSAPTTCRHVFSGIISRPTFSFSATGNTGRPAGYRTVYGGTETTAACSGTTKGGFRPIAANESTGDV